MKKEFFYQRLLEEDNARELAEFAEYMKEFLLGDDYDPIHPYERDLMDENYPEFPEEGVEDV